MRADQIILITYLNRSGSTFLANLLSSSGDICVCPEGDAVVGLFLEAPGRGLKEGSMDSEALARTLKCDGKMAAWDLGDDDLKRLKGNLTGIEAFYTLLKSYRDRNKPAASHIVFKAERIGALMTGIALAARDQLPSPVKFISLLRDPRAVYASQKNTRIPGCPYPMSGNPVWTALKWRTAQRQIRVLRSGTGGLIGRKASPGGPGSNEVPFSTGRMRKPEMVFHMLVKYEDLVSEMSRVQQDLGQFLGLDLRGTSPGRGDLVPKLDAQTRSIHPLADKEPRAERVDAWTTQLTQKEIYLVERSCRKYMQHSGYAAISETRGINLEITRLFQAARFRTRRIYLTLRFHFIGRAKYDKN